MSLEQGVKDIAIKLFEDGTMEQIIEKQLTKGVDKALEDIFNSWGKGSKTIKEQIESVMIPYLENYDYSKYMLKIDAVMTEVIKNSTAEHTKLLENFKTLMATDEYNDRTIKSTELFEKWMNYVAEEVNTDDLEIHTDDRAYYENVEVSFEVDYDNSRSWSIYEYANLVFECDHDEDMNYSVRLYRWKESSDKGWGIELNRVADIKSLRHLNDLDLLFMSLAQQGVKVILDSDGETTEVEVKAEPELSYS